MVARRNGRNPQSSIAPSADGAILGKAEGRRPHPVSGWRMAALCRTVPDHEPPTILNVGAGIPDGPGRNAPWTRQGCRVLRNGYAFAPIHRSTAPGTARRHTQVPPYEWDGSLFGVRGKRESRRPPPREGWGRRLSALPGVAPSADGPSADGAFGRFRDFARCDGRPEALPLDSAILGCTPSVGKSGRRGILRQAKVWVRSHTGCMARNRTAGMAHKARRAPQTHGRWAAPQEKNRVKLL